MKKISTKSQCEHLCGLPPPVVAEIEKSVALLNFYYGENRNPDTDLGGYVLLIENAEELKKIIFFSTNSMHGKQTLRETLKKQGNNSNEYQQTACKSNTA